uniref:Odorant Binding Protein 27 n=1 Tax=Dendrolimus punctatus TaxID=238572 RepID=A0A2K8GKN0_9NEOP|nr:Odorant Binding Protein 27 [Dendrolimus punctatus]
MSLVTKIVFILTLGFASSQIGNRRPLHLPAELNAQFDAIAHECIKKTNNTERVWTLFKKHTFEDSDEYKRFIYCGLTTSQFYAENGVPVLEKLFELFKDDDVRQVFNNCRASLVITTPVETASSYFKCYIENSPVYMALT